MTYTKTTFVNGKAPAVSAEELNNFGDGILEAIEIAENAKQIVPYTFTKDPVSFPNFVPWKRTDFPTDEYRIYVNGQKHRFNLESIISDFPLSPHVEGYIYRNGTKYFEFFDRHNNQTSGTSSDPENKTLVSWKSQFVTLSLAPGDYDATKPSNNPYFNTVDGLDLSAIKSIKIDWEGISSVNDTDFPMVLRVNGVTGKELSYTSSFSRRTDTLNVSDVFGTNNIEVSVDDRANWKSATITLTVHSIELIPF